MKLRRRIPGLARVGCWLASLGLASAGGSSAAPQWPALEGELSGDFAPLAIAGAPKLHWTLTLETPSPERRTARLIVDGLETQARIELQLEAENKSTWRLTEGQTALKLWLNGQLTAGEITVAGEGAWDEEGIEGRLTLDVRGADLGELLRFADAEQKYVQTAEGRVEGRVLVRLKAGAPEQFEVALGLAPGTMALIRFQPSPGLLTDHVPDVVRKYYPGLEAIELGQTPLEAKVLRLTTHPGGDAQGRSAQVRVEGRPSDPRFVAPLELDINVTGPLEELLRKIIDSRLKIGVEK